MALSENTPYKKEGGEYNSVPLASAAKLFQGSMVGGNGSGYGRALTAGDAFLGHSQNFVDNTSGSDGDLDAQILTGRYRLQVTVASVSITNAEDKAPVYASADDTITLTPGTNTLVGRVVRYVASNTAVVEFETSSLESASSLLMANVTATELVDVAGTDVAYVEATYTLDGSRLRVGDIIRIQATVLAADFHTEEEVLVKLWLGTEILLTTGDVVIVANDDTITIDFSVLIHTIGSSGKILPFGKWDTDLSGTVVNYIIAPTGSNRAGIGEDISGDVVIKVTGDYKNAHADQESYCWMKVWLDRLTNIS